MIRPLRDTLRTAAPPGARVAVPPATPPASPCDLVTVSEAPAPTPTWRGVALAGLAALSAFAALSAGAAGGPPTSIVVLDEFRHADQPGVTTHGELVEAELRGSCTATGGFRRLQVDLGASMQGLEQGRPGALDDYVRARFERPLVDTARALQQVPPGTVISQSQGASESRVVEALWNRADLRPTLARELGVPADGPVLQALVDRVHEVHVADPSVARARQALQDAAAGSRAVRVNSAGNQGALDARLREAGVRIPDGFYRSDLVAADTVVVGAADDRNTPDPQDDGAAELASPDAGAVVGMDGVERPLCVDGRWERHSGSSYAAPQAARVVEEILQSRPDATAAEVRQLLQDTARPVPGGERKVGAGLVDPGAVRERLR